jgi:hypothetical protein
LQLPESLSPPFRTALCRPSTVIFSVIAGLKYDAIVRVDFGAKPTVCFIHLQAFESCSGLKSITTYMMVFHHLWCGWGDCASFPVVLFLPFRSNPNRN